MNPASSGQFAVPPGAGVSSGVVKGLLDEGVLEVTLRTPAALDVIREMAKVEDAVVGAGTVLNAVATAAYIGVRLGPGPRDGLMTGLVRRTGGSVRVVRTAIEVVVVLACVAANVAPFLLLTQVEPT